MKWTYIHIDINDDADTIKKKVHQVFDEVSRYVKLHDGEPGATTWAESVLIEVRDGEDFLARFISPGLEGEWDYEVVGDAVDDFIADSLLRKGLQGEEYKQAFRRVRRSEPANEFEEGIVGNFNRIRDEVFELYQKRAAAEVAEKTVNLVHQQIEMAKARAESQLDDDEPDPDDLDDQLDEDWSVYQAQLSEELAGPSFGR